MLGADGRCEWDTGDPTIHFFLVNPHDIDAIKLAFNPGTLVFLNIALGLVMFGVALELKAQDFRDALKVPRALLIGVLGHHLLFPAMTFGLVTLLQPAPSIALGMILVSSCPAGHISNFLTHLARGNTAISVSVSAVSTVIAMVLTPLNFAFWGNLHPITHDLMREVHVSPMEMLEVIFVLLGLPLAAGMWLAKNRPALAHKLQKPMKIFSMLVLLSFILGALAANFQHFQNYIHLVVGTVFLHNLMAFVTGYGLSAAAGLVERDRRAVTYEMGIQNSGLGLILIFNFFEGLGGMAIITAWWGVWHIVAGLALALFWRARDPAPLTS